MGVDDKQIEFFKGWNLLTPLSFSLRTHAHSLFHHAKCFRSCCRYYVTLNLAIFFFIKCERKSSHVWIELLTSYMWGYIYGQTIGCELIFNTIFKTIISDILFVWLYTWTNNWLWANIQCHIQTIIWVTICTHSFSLYSSYAPCDLEGICGIYLGLI